MKERHRGRTYRIKSKGDSLAFLCAYSSRSSFVTMGKKTSEGEGAK